MFVSLRHDKENLSSCVILTSLYLIIIICKFFTVCHGIYNAVRQEIHVYLESKVLQILRPVQIEMYFYGIVVEKLQPSTKPLSMTKVYYISEEP